MLLLFFFNAGVVAFANEETHANNELKSVYSTAIRVNRYQTDGTKIFEIPFFKIQFFGINTNITKSPNFKNDTLLFYVGGCCSKSSVIAIELPHEVLVAWNNKIPNSIAYDINSDQKPIDPDGALYILAPGVKQECYSQKNYIYTVTSLERNNTIAAYTINEKQSGPSDNGKIIVINLKTKSVVSEFDVPQFSAFQRMFWIDDRYILCTSYSRNSCGYDIIDLKNKLLIRGKSQANGISYFVENGMVHGYDFQTKTLVKIFEPEKSNP